MKAVISITVLSALLHASVCIRAEVKPDEPPATDKIDSFKFIGYDISCAKVTDPRRSGVDLTRYMLELVGELQISVTEKKLTKWSGSNKVEMLQNELYEKNKNVKSADIFYPNYNGKSLLTKDSIQVIINNYKLSENVGTGFVIIFEFLSKEKKSVSGYGVFFDIKSRKITKLIEHESYDGNSYNSFRDFWVPAQKLVRDLLEKVNPKNQYNK